jgi:hypothetical protein
MTRLAHETPDLVDVISELIEDRIKDLDICFPGTIKAIDKPKGLVDVQSDFKRLYWDQDDPVDPPTIRGVTLWQYRSGTARINMPVKVGEKVICLCSQRSLDKWKQSGALDTPGSTRVFSMSDAIAIPGLYDLTRTFPIGDNFTIQFGQALLSFIEDTEISLEVTKAKARITKDGKFSLSNGTVELIDMCIKALEAQNAMIDLIKQITVPTGLGPSGTPINAAQFDQQKQTNQQLIDKLTQLKLG